MKVAIVGAGVGGLAAAYDLAVAGAQVTIFEAADDVGGLASGFQLESWEWSVERFYHHWFASDKAMLGLIDELGLSEKVLFPRPITAVYHEGRFYPLDSALAVLRFPAVSFIERLRLGMVVAYLKYIARWQPLEAVTASAWLKRWVGARAYRILWEPLLIGKFGPYYQDVNMAWFWARVKARTPRLGTFEGGFQAFNHAFAGKLKQMGVDLRLSTPVEKLEADPNGGLELTVQGEQLVFDRCLVTSSPGQLARLAPSLSGDYLDQLLKLRSMGAVVLILALKHQLSEGGIYWHNLPKSAGFPFLSLVEHTNYVDPRHFGGDHIVYIGDYLDPGHEYFSLSKEELLERFLPSLNRFNPSFSEDWVRESWMFRTAYAQPVPPVDHSKAIPDLKTPIPGLWFASMSQVYPWDRGTNFAVAIGRKAAQEMIAA
ncbi:MAG: NAD(P)/FAD-dependent oxidoreductase [Anaerolineales bacterium]|nr:MAG: NAD(P)/FAD-dependent oxidoreductase [Anaerolineales bacterium]